MLLVWGVLNKAMRYVDSMQTACRVICDISDDAIEEIGYQGRYPAKSSEGAPLRHRSFGQAGQFRGNNHRVFPTGFILELLLAWQASDQILDERPAWLAFSRFCP